MNVTAEHAGRAVVLELDEGCRSVAALRRIICAALPDLEKDGFDVKMQGRVLEDVDVCGLEEGTKVQVVVTRRAVALEALRAAGRDVSEEGLKRGMFEAVRDGEAKLCEQYLDAGCDVNALDEHGAAPLHIAARQTSPELCTLLLQRGADINAFDRHGAAPLHIAACQSQPDICRVLLQCGADVNAFDRCGEAPLHVAARHSQPDICRVLLQCGADINAFDRCGEAPLHVAARHSQPDVCRVLLQCGADVNAFDEHGAAPLHAAACEGQPDTCRLLVQCGADVNALDKRGVAPLHVAARHCRPDTCRVLLQCGADVNKRSDERNHRNNTPLHDCRRCRGPSSELHQETREVLLSHGADMHAANSYGHTPLHYARREERRYFLLRDNEAAYYGSRDGRVLGRKRRRKPGSITDVGTPQATYDLFVKYGAPEIKKKRWLNPFRKAYEGGIHKLAKVQFKERKQQITWEGMKIVNAFVEDVLERLGGEAGRVTSFSGAKTLSVRSVVAAVKLQLPEELATHALAAGTAAVRRYAKACERR